jgi:hypothetical protein
MHETLGTARTTMQASGELDKEKAGKRAVEALNGVANGVAIGGVKARLEKVCVVGAKGLSEDSSKGLVSTGHKRVPCGLGDDCAIEG